MSEAMNSEKRLDEMTIPFFQGHIGGAQKKETKGGHFSFLH